MIRRPVVVITSSFFITVIFIYYYGLFISICLLFAFCLLINIKKKKFIKNNTAMFVVFGCVLGAIMFIYSNTLFPSEIEEGDNVSAVAVIKKIDSKEEDLSLKACIKIINGKKINGNCNVLIKINKHNTENNKNAKSLDYRPGDTIIAEGIVLSPQGRRNPGCFDYGLYLKSIGIDKIINAEKITVTGNNKKPLQSKIYDKKLLFIKKLNSCMKTQSADLVGAIMFGDKYQLDEDILELFQKNGTAHILAVSGLHLGIIYWLFSSLWIWKKRWMFLAMVLFIFYCYMTIASFSPSVVRASIMIFLHSFAVVVNCRYDMTSAAFLTALFMMIINPMSVFNTGFQLSFIAVLTISVIMPVVKRVYTGIFLCSFTVQLGIWPILTYTFNHISIITVFLNIPIIFLLSIILPLSVFLFIISGLSGFNYEFFNIMAKILDNLCAIMVDMNKMAEIEGVTSYDVTSPDLKFILVYYFLLFAFISEAGRLFIIRKKAKAIMSLLIVSVCLSVALWIPAGNHFKQSDIVFVDVGQGDCVHVRSDNGNFLFDGGGTVNYNTGKKTIKPYLLKNGVRCIDGAFVSHLHTDHYKGIVELCNEGMIKKLYVYEANKVRESEILQETGLSRNDIYYIYEGQTIYLDKNLSVKVLWPSEYVYSKYEEIVKDSEDENKLSTILKVNIRGKTFILTADIDDICMEEIAGKYKDELRSTIIKVPHHGSKYSWNEPFIDYTSPEYAVIQVGKNNFGHPDNSIIENYLKKGIIVYRTDLDGAVVFTIDKYNNIKAKTVRGEAQ